MMTKTKLIRFVKQLRDIERRGEDLDFQRAAWTARVRAEYPSGDLGDKQFCDALQQEFGRTAYQSREMLVMARAAGVIDSESWRRLGCFANIRAVRFISRDDQIAVVSQAASENKPVRTVMRERGHLPEIKRAPRGESDVELLARWIRDHGRNVPKRILEIVARYTRDERKLAA